MRARLLEFLGGRTVEDLTAVYLTTRDGGGKRDSVVPVSAVDRVLAWPGELNRSLWDRRSLLVHLDIEHVNFDRPLEYLTSPERVFGVQRPVVQATQAELLRSGIAPLHLLSGRGHHLIWSVEQDSRAFARLAGLGAATGFGRVAERKVPAELQLAHIALGLVLEYLAHCVVRAASCPVPVQVTAVEVGPGAGGREIVSIDLSEYGDPLEDRTTRMPFSLYLKHGMAPPLVMLPLHEMDEDAARAVMGDLDKAWELASRASVQIPNQACGMNDLIDRYEASGVADFHRWFYSQPQLSQSWDPDQLPDCVRRPLLEPNDFLLKPAALQNVVRSLMAMEWHPRRISGLVRSIYEEDHGWEPGLHFYDPALRADFYCRLFSGLVAVGMDRLVDFNCRSCQEKGYCSEAGCGHNLARLRQRLL